jgi:type IV secretion system protein TrbG
VVEARFVKGIVIGVVLIVWSATARSQVAPADSSGDAVAIAEQEAARGWSARTVRAGDEVVFPFGRTQPTVVCAPLRACVIELQAGERILGSAAGDAERWLVDRTVTGAGGRTVLVVVKPVACDLTTNLVLSTDRRVYDITLSSPPCGSKAASTSGEYARHVSFYYPDALVTHGSGADSVAVMGDGEIRPEALNFAYHWTAGRRIRWSPAAVYDDGIHGYVKLRASASHDELPALFVVGGDGKLEVLNYAVRGGDTFVTDRVFDRAALVVGPNGKGGRVDIVSDRVEPGRQP